MTYAASTALFRFLYCHACSRVTFIFLASDLKFQLVLVSDGVKSYAVFLYEYVNDDADKNVRNEPRREKPVFAVSDQVRYKPGCAATEDG